MSNLDFFKEYIPKKTESTQAPNLDVIGYTRVSSKQQVTNYSIPEQESAIIAYCNANRYRLTSIIGGTYESASGDFDRKEFSKLIDEIKKSKKRPFAIIIKFINRFSRTGGNAISIVEELVEKMGVHLIEASSGLCTQNESQRIEIYQKLLRAKQENTDRLKATLPGMIDFLKEGKWLGKAPLGYTMRGKRVRDLTRISGTQEITINAEGELLRKAWKLKLAGEQDFVIRKKLADMGLKISKQKLNAMWSKPFYCGVIVNALLDEPVKGNWEPLISIDEFKKIKLRGNRATNVKYNTEAHDESRPLSRFVVCSNCNNLLTGYINQKKGLHYYKCNVCKGATFNAITTKKSLKAGLNNDFFELLAHYKLPDEFIDEFKQHLHGFFRTMNADTLAIIENLERSIRQLEEKQKQMQLRFLSMSGIDQSVFDEQMRLLNTEKTEKQLSLAEMRSQLSNPELFVDEAIEIARNLHVYWQLGDWTTKQRIQKMVFPGGIMINPVNRCYLTTKVNPFFVRIRYLSSSCSGYIKELAGKNADQSVLVAGIGLEPMTFGL